MTKTIQIISIFLLGLAVNAIAFINPKAVHGADLRIHYQWATQFIESLHEGVAYPRWAGLSNLGLGDPTFIYIHPLFYYATAAVQLWREDIWSALLWVPALSTGVTAAIAFITLRRNTGNAIALSIAALIALSPYAFHLAHYQQFLPMHFAMYAVVVYLWAWAKPNGWQRLFLLALAVGLLAGSHIFMAFMLLLVMAPVALLRAARQTPDQRWLALLCDACGVALGLGLAAIYLLPALTSQQLITPSGWYKPVSLDWHNAFIFQIFTLPSTGYRWFHLQWTIPLVTLGLTLVSGWIIWFTRIQKTAGWWLAVDFSIATALALLLGSELSHPLWEHIGFIQRLQFPVRLLGVASITSIFGFGYAVSALRAAGQQKKTFTILVFALLGSASLLGLLEFKFAQEANDAHSISVPFDQFQGQPEMKPAGVGKAWTAYVRNGGLAEECRAHGVECANPVHLTHDQTWTFHTTAPHASLRLPLFWFPGWEFRMDGAVVWPTLDPDSGLVKVDIPPGDSTVEARWTGLPIEKIGTAISLVSLLIFSLLAASLWIRRPPAAA